MWNGAIHGLVGGQDLENFIKSHLPTEVSPMPRPSRSELFDPTEAEIALADQRCVRWAFLAEVDQATGNDYSYRKEWIRKWMEALASVFVYPNGQRCEALWHGVFYG